MYIGHSVNNNDKIKAIDQCKVLNKHKKHISIININIYYIKKITVPI